MYQSDKLKEFEELFLSTLAQRRPETLKTFQSGKLADDAVKVVTDLAAELTAQYK